MQTINPQPKNKPLRDKKYLKWLITQRPLISGDGDTVAHHLKCLGGGGTGIKPPDNHCIPLPESVHRDVHQYGERTVLDGTYGYNLKALEQIAAEYYDKYTLGQ